jgi:MSHA pilin protein MshD
MWKKMIPILFKKNGMRIRQRGISLIELIMFIVIVSVAVAGILLVLNVTTKSSADPLVHKQALAIAESLLEEVELMPFTLCDPNDVNAASAVSATDCTAGLDQNKGGAALTSATPGSETRYSASTPFDNVADYGGFSMPKGAIMDITNNNIGLAGYKADIAINRGALSGLPADAALLITVTVTGPDNLPVVLEGIRTRYSPNP